MNSIPAGMENWGGTAAPVRPDDSRQPFWNRTTAWFALGGLAAYVSSLWLFETRSVVQVTLVSVIRLLLGIGPAVWLARPWGWRFHARWYWLALATPYPIEGSVLLYAKRFDWLPRAVVLELSGPTAFLIFVTALVLASRYVTVWAVGKALDQSESAHLRRLGNLLFLLTAAGVVLAPPTLSIRFLKYVAEPTALIGYCALFGHAQSERRITGSNTGTAGG